VTWVGPIFLTQQECAEFAVHSTQYASLRTLEQGLETHWTACSSFPKLLRALKPGAKNKTQRTETIIFAANNFTFNFDN